MKANERKVLPNQEEPKQTAVELPPVSFYQSPEVYSPAAAETPYSSPSVDTGMLYDAGGMNTSPMNEASYPDMTNPIAGYSNPVPPESMAASPVPLANGEPAENYMSDPTAYWTPPCMQEGLFFPTEYPMPVYPSFDPNSADATMINNEPYMASQMWPSVESNIPETNSDNPEFAVPPSSSSSFNPTVMASPETDGIPEFPATLHFTNEMPDMNANVNASEPVNEEVFSPSQYWPQTVETEADAAVDTSIPDEPGKSLTAESAADLYPPSAFRPNLQTLPIPITDDVTASAPPMAQPEAEQQMGNALLQMHVTTGKQAEPVPNARVIIFKPDGDQEILLKVITTDVSGNTPPVPLPAMQAKYSLHSGSSKPTRYTIETTAPGYYRTRHIHIPIYGGVASVQDIEMTPLPEGEDDNQEMIFDQDPMQETQETKE